MDSRGIVRYRKPKLFKPNLIMGFEGWADAARISSGVIDQLTDKLDAKRLAEIKSDAFYLFQSPDSEARRPITDVKSGQVQALHLPSTMFRFFKNRRGFPDLIIALAAEPDLKWNSYAELVLDLAEEFGVERLYTIGGTYGNVPHSVDPIVTAVLSHKSMNPEMAKHGIGLTEYAGPSSIHTMLVVAARERGLPAVALWGHAPYYVQVPNPKICHGILNMLAPMLDIDIEIEDLRRAAAYLDEQVNDAVRQSPQLQEYVSGIELAYGRAGSPAAVPPHENVIREIEEFLRASSREGPPPSEGEGTTT